MRFGFSVLLTVVTLFGSVAFGQTAAPKADDKAPLGSPQFMPSPARPIGWRGDGTGLYPGATPTTNWGIIVNGPFGTARYQAAKPAGDKPAADANDFNPCGPKLTDFLIVGPFTSTATDAAAVLKEETVPNESSLAGAEGTAVKDCKWKTGTFKGKDDKDNGFWTGTIQVAYAHTYLYFEEAGSVDLSFEHTGMKLWLNGKEVFAEAKPYKYALGRVNCRWFTMPVEKGWNRLLVKVLRADVKDGWFHLMGMPTKAPAYTNKNIQWAIDMPDYSYSTPVIVGDRLFTTSDPADLCCFDKTTGKLLWVRSTLAWYAAEDDEKADSAAPKEISADRSKVDRLEKMNNDYAADPAKFDQKARKALEKELVESVGKNKKYTYVLHGWGGGNSASTPCTDGKDLYIWHGEAGTLGCYGLDGTRKWVRYIDPQGKGEGSHHGTNGSPVICGDMMVIPGWGCMIGVRRSDGSEVWRIKYSATAYSNGVTDKIEGTDVIILPTGAIVRVSDGTSLTPPFKGRYDGECASAAIDRVGRTFAVQAWGELSIARIPDKLNAPAPIIGTIKAGELNYMVGSPLIDGGLVYYCGTRGLLRVADTATGTLVCEKQLPVYPFTDYGPTGAGIGASLCKVGGNIYAFDNRGTSVIFATGREYKQVAVNRIQSLTQSGDNQEVFQGTPVFDGARIYLRGARRLYCIGEK